MKKLIFFFFILFSTCLLAQVGINTTTPNAQLDIKSSNQATPSNTDGVLIPKVDAFPATNPTAAQQGMLVYLTTNVGSSQPGFYYWDNPTTSWIPIGNNNNLGWNLLGNSGTNPTTNFIGTTDEQDLVFKRNNSVVGRIGETSIAFGRNSLSNNFLASTGNTAVGESTLRQNLTGNSNTAIGSSAMGSNVTGTGNTAVGRFALNFNETGSSNVALGATSLYRNTDGINNTAIGVNSLFNNLGNDNTGVGRGALSDNVFGNENTGLGRLANVSNSNLSNTTAVGARAEVGVSNALVLGSINGVNGATSSVNVGIGTTTPEEPLHVVGNIRMVDGNQASGNILTSDTNGTATWVDPNTVASGTLDQAYDFGGAGLGSTITADAGAVTIAGNDGLVSTGTINNGITAPSGAGTRMVWNPRKAAFRVGTVLGTTWNDTSIGEGSSAFGNSTLASGKYSFAFGDLAEATGYSSTSFGFQNIASGNYATAFGGGNLASGELSVAFGNGATASGMRSTAFGQSNTASGFASTAFGQGNQASSYAEVVLGIGASNYTTSTNGSTQFRVGNATDRLFVIGNAVDTNNDNLVQDSERRDAMVVLKNGLTRLPSTTNTMINDADGKAVVTKEYLQSNTSGTLDQAYDFGGAGLGRTIIADAGAVTINGTDGLVSTGTFGSGAVALSGAGVKMFWNPRKAAFRAGEVDGNQWDDGNLGDWSTAIGLNTIASGQGAIAFGVNTVASGPRSFAMGNLTTASGASSVAFCAFTSATESCATAFGFQTSATGQGATAFGNSSIASGSVSTAFGQQTNASGFASTAFGDLSTASGDVSTAFGRQNTASSYGETVIGIGATTYTPSANGATQFRTANATDRLFVIGNAIDLNNNNSVNDAERRDAMVVLKNGNTGIGTSTPSRRLHVSNGPSGGTSNSNTGLLLESSGAVYQHFLSPSNFEKGLLFGSETATITGAIIHNNTNALEGFQFRTGGNATRMTLTNLGELGVGTNTPAQKLEVSNAGTVFARITNTSSTDVGIEFKRSGSDWRVHNTTGLLLFGQSTDDLATVTDVLRLGGASVTPAADNTITLGNSMLKWTAVFATNGAIQTSDANDKKEMKSLTFGLDKIKQLRPISFKWKDGAIDNSATHLGFVAQEVQEILPEVIVDSDWVELPEGLGKVWQKSEKLGMKYSEIIPVLVKGIQEQQSVIEKQQQEIDGLKQQLQEQYQILLDRIKKVEGK